MDLVDVYEGIAEDPRFAHLRADGNKLVWGRGNDKSPLAIVIGEAPGATEARVGKPFVGLSGQLLTGLIGLAGLDDEEIWITNTVKYRPTDELGRNRTPWHDEIMSSTGHLRKEWRAVKKPPLMITCGAVPLKAILRDNRMALGKLIGDPIKLGTDLILVPMFHPAYPLRQRSLIPTVEQQWTDMSWIVQMAREVKAEGKRWPKEISRPTD